MYWRRLATAKLTRLQLGTFARQPDLVLWLLALREKEIVLDIYRRFRTSLIDMRVVSLDQFISDFLAYLNSFRWEAIRGRRGFDFVFADELHLFNRQERRTLGYLLRDRSQRVAVAYDPRQSPRNTFFPGAAGGADRIWAEARLDAGARQFELTDVFRYTPQILAFMRQLNRHFPADDLAEEWAITFGNSMIPDHNQEHICMRTVTKWLRLPLTVRASCFVVLTETGAWLCFASIMEGLCASEEREFFRTVLSPSAGVTKSG